MKSKSKKEVSSEIARLRSLVGRLKTKHSAFGDDHAAALEAQIKTLSDGLTEGQCYDIYGENSDEDMPRYELDNALTAARWLTGDGDTSPSSEWEESPHLFRQ